MSKDTPMFLFHITRADGGGGYDVYDDIVVSAESEEHARYLHPEHTENYAILRPDLKDENRFYFWDEPHECWSYQSAYARDIKNSRGTFKKGEIFVQRGICNSYFWPSPDKLNVRKIGTSDLPRGVICANFCAG